MELLEQLALIALQPHDPSHHRKHPSAQTWRGVRDQCSPSTTTDVCNKSATTCHERSRSNPARYITHSEAHELRNQFGIVETVMLRGQGEVFVLRNLWVWIGLQQIGFLCVGHAEVEPRIAAHAEQAVDFPGGLSQVLPGSP